MSHNIKASVARRDTGEIVAHVEAQDAADLARYETDEYFLINGIHDPDSFVGNPRTYRANKRKAPRELPIEYVRDDVRRRRNQLLDETAWTVLPDSPLTSASRDQWLAYRAQLHRLLLGCEDVRAVAFPEQPALEFKAEETKT